MIKRFGAVQVNVGAIYVEGAVRSNGPHTSDWRLSDRSACEVWGARVFQASLSRLPACASKSEGTRAGWRHSSSAAYGPEKVRWRSNWLVGLSVGDNGSFSPRESVDGTESSLSKKRVLSSVG